MKKFIVLILLFALMLSLCACNQAVGWGELSFKHAHVWDSVESRCIDVITWHDSEGPGVEVRTAGGSAFLSEGCYMMYSDANTCPFCN